MSIVIAPKDHKVALSFSANDGSSSAMYFFNKDENIKEGFTFKGKIEAPSMLFYFT